MDDVSWWVPRWDFAPKHVRAQRESLRSMSLTRVVLAGLVGSAAICGTFKSCYPELDFSGLWRLPVAFVGLIGLLVFNVIVLPVLIPPRVRVSREAIRCSQGESGWVAPRDECSTFLLVIFSTDLRRLVFRYKGMRRSIGLAESVDVHALRALLPLPVKTFDLSRRFQRRRKALSAGRVSG